MLGRHLWLTRVEKTGDDGLPEVSPDGTLVLYGNFMPPNASLNVLRLADGAEVPFRIQMADTRTRNETGYITHKTMRSLGMLVFDNQARV